MEEEVVASARVITASVVREVQVEQVVPHFLRELGHHREQVRHLVPVRRLEQVGVDLQVLLRELRWSHP